MRLDILDHGHRLGTKALLGMIRLVSRQPVVDAVKLALYRKDFYGAGDLTHEAMRGPSEWSIGDRELMAAYVAQADASPFCIAAHSATAGQWYGDPDKVTATLADLDTAPIEEPLRATLRLLGQLSREDAVSVDDIHRVLSAGVSPAQIEDALAVGLAFNITARLANAFDFDLATTAAMESGARYLLQRGYR
jgi:alkylhydroperoxidase family enzyme